jgi:hypothetical protein
VARSGLSTQKVRVTFAAPDDPERATGVAGQAATHRRTISAENLPDVSSAAATAADFEEYANKSACKVTWIRMHRPKARTLIGFPVEANGRIWGSLVIDSRTPGLDVRAIATHQKKISKTLESLLRGV